MKQRNTYVVFVLKLKLCVCLTRDIKCFNSYICICCFQSKNENQITTTVTDNILKAGF